MPELSPRKAARSPGEAALTPRNCSVCPRVPQADARDQKPQRLQVLLRKNTSAAETLPAKPLGPQASRLPRQRPRAFLGSCSLPGVSCLDRFTPGASHLPPASPEAPQSLPAMSATSLPPSRVPGTLHTHSGSEGLSPAVIKATRSSGPVEAKQDPSEPPTVSSVLPGSSLSMARLSSSSTVSPSSSRQKPTENPSLEGEQSV
ncbi:von Willebrand factor C and EGF domain-containing protein-like [Vombatus ursinus]|nr:von Willebrand factor C and EGF domain-containing protein-like [Vombatus ursinus]